MASPADDLSEARAGLTLLVNEFVEAYEGHLWRGGLLEKRLQSQCERRLRIGYEVEADESGPPESNELAGPFCGCDACLVREVLDAAWKERDPADRAAFEAALNVLLQRGRIKLNLPRVERPLAGQTTIDEA